MKTIFLFLITLFFHLSLPAQDTAYLYRTPPQESGSIEHFGYLSVGYQYSMYNSFTDQSSKLGNDFTLNGDALTISGTGYTVCHRLIYGGEFGGSVSNPTPEARLVSAHLSQLYGYFDLGYLVVKRPSTLLYPFIGIGGAYLGLTVRNKTSNDIHYQTFTIESEERGNFSAAGVALKLGLGVKKSILKTRRGYAFQLGLDAGVRYMPYKSNWYYNGNSRKVEEFGYADNIAYYAVLTIGRGIH